MYVYEIPSRIYKKNYHRSGCYQYKRHGRRISQENHHFENQVLTKLLLITLARKFSETFNNNLRQVLSRNLAKLGYCYKSNRWVLIIYASNLEDAFTLAAHQITLLHQIQRLLSNEGYLAIYQGTSEVYQEVLITSLVQMTDILD